MNGTNKLVNLSSAAKLCTKLAGTLGFAGASALLAVPAFSASSSLSKVNPNPTIFSEAPYSRVAQSTGGTAAPGGTPTNPSAAPVAEPSNIGPTLDRSTTPGSLTTPGSSTDSTTTPSAAPGGTPTNPSAAPSDGGSGADVVVPSSGDFTTPGGTTAPTAVPGGAISPDGNNPTDSTTTPSSIPGTPGTTSPDGMFTPDSTTTPGSTTTPDGTFSPDGTFTPDSTTSPSSTPSGGDGGVRALW